MHSRIEECRGSIYKNLIFRKFDIQITKNLDLVVWDCCVVMAGGEVGRIST